MSGVTILRLSEAAVLLVGLAVVAVRFGFQASDRQQAILVCLNTLELIAFFSFFWAQWGISLWTQDILYQLSWPAPLITSFLSPDPIRWFLGRRRKPVAG